MLKNKRLLRIIAVLAVMVMSVCMLTGCEIKSEESKNDNQAEISSNEEVNKIVKEYEEPISNLIKGLSEANSEKFTSAFPEYLSSYMKDIFTDEYLAETLQEAETDYGANITMEYSITSESKIAEEDLRSMEEIVKETFSEEINITKGYKVEIEITTKGDSSENIENDGFDVYEIDGKWYLLNM